MAAQKLDGAVQYPDAFDATWAGSGGAGQPDAGMGGSGGGNGQADTGDSGNFDGTEVRLVLADGGWDVVFQSDGMVPDEGLDVAAPLDDAAQLDDAAPLDGLVEPPDGEPDTAVQQDAATQPDEAVRLDVMVDDDAATRLDVVVRDTLPRDTMDADAPPPMFCDPTNPDLLACYRFEGSIDDGSSYANHGSASNVSYVTGVAGQAVRTSSNSDIVVPSSASLVPTNAITIELWARPQTTLASGRAGLVDNDVNYSIFVRPGNSVSCTVGGGSVNGSSVLVTAGWTHIACVYDGASVRLYQNGSLVGSVAETGSVSTGGPAGLRIGHNNPTGDPFDGAIDGLRIWRVARAPGLLCTQPSDCG